MHVLVERDQMRVVRGPKENRSRPAIDPLFRTAARWNGSRVIGVVLSGALNDGTAGLLAIKRRGGIAIVQEPHGAAVSMMPESALMSGKIWEQAQSRGHRLVARRFEEKSRQGTARAAIIRDVLSKGIAIIPDEQREQNGGNGLVVDSETNSQAAG